MTKNGDDITAESLKLRYQGKDIQRKTLLSVFMEHNEQMSALLGKGFKPNTLKGYRTSLSHIERYIKNSYTSKDMEVRQLDHAFVSSYAFFLRSELNCTDISAAKYIKHLRKIVKICIAHKWITADPFASYQNKAKPKEKTFLTADELQRIEQKSFVIPRLEHVRDIFIFCCYTGLSYADVKKLTSNYMQMRRH